MSQINSPALCFKELEKEEQKKSKIVEERINNDKNINKWKRQKINKANNLILEKRNKFDKSLTRPTRDTKERRLKIQKILRN